jgi:hypothetical protein
MSANSTDATMGLAAVRRERLKQIVADVGGYDQAHVLFASSRARLSRLINPSQKLSRPISDEEARDFEKRAGKPVGWLDNNSDRDQEDSIDIADSRISLSIEENIPPRTHGLRMKDYGEKLFLEAWSHRLRTNALRHRGLVSVVNVSAWRSGWLSVIARGHMTVAEAAGVITSLRAMKDSIHAYAKVNPKSDVVIVPVDTVVVGEEKPQNAAFLLDPQPAPPSSIHRWLDQRQTKKSETFGDLAAVFQITIWGDDTLRAAFSGFPLRNDVPDIEAKLEQLRVNIEATTNVYRVRQAGTAAPTK